MHIFTDQINIPFSKEIVLYTHENSPHFDSEEEWMDWVGIQGEIILQVQCRDGLLNVVRSWDVRESLIFQEFFREKAVCKKHLQVQSLIP